MIMLIFSVFIFIVGAIFGSFFNVLIDRLPNNENPFKGRSHCDFCKKKLAWFDLIPVVSFVWLRGRCRYCHKKLSWQYPIVEIITGVLFVLLALYIFNPQTSSWLVQDLTSDSGLCQNDVSVICDHSIKLFLQYLSLLIIFSSFLVIFVADLKYQIIPDELVVSAGVGALLYQFILHAGDVPKLGYAVLAGLGASLFFYLIYFLTKGKGIGFGDVKLVFSLGLFLGVAGVVVGLYVAFLTGAAVSSILVLSQRKRWKTRIAFAPFLLVGATVSFFFGQQLINWYAAFFS